MALLMSRTEKYDYERAMIVRRPVCGTLDLAWWLMMRSSPSAERFRRRNLAMTRAFASLHRVTVASRMASLIRHRAEQETQSND